MNKKQRKRIKQERLKNKKLLKKYPWLKLRNPFTGKTYDGYDCTELDALPQGWRIAFGDMIVEEIHQELVKSNYVDKYRIFQIKEKYGILCWYDNSPSNALDKIRYKYEMLSSNICIRCGKPDVKTTSGWVTPICEKCYEGNYSSLNGEGKMEDYYEYSTYNPTTKETTKHTVYIGDTAQKIRENWHKKHKEKTKENKKCNTMHEEV